MYAARLTSCIATALALYATAARAQEIRPAAELGLSGLAPDERVLVLTPDPAATPVEPAWQNVGPGLAAFGHYSSGEIQSITPNRNGCPDEGFSQYAYARDSGNDWPWIPANTLVADDLTLLPGTWEIGCYDVLIRARNSAAIGCNHTRTMTLRAYNACNGSVIPGSQETWTIPSYNGPILLTGVTNVDFVASGTIYFGMTTTAEQCDGWYLGQQQIAGSTTNTFQLIDDCAACINPPSCSPWSGFIVILYGCKFPTIAAQPAGGEICAGGWHQFCVTIQGTGTVQYQWQKDGNDIGGAMSACYVATETGSYRCIATDSCNSVTSNAATLTIRTGPVVTAAPQPDAICSGHVPHLCVAADAIGTLHYQWKRGGLTIIGATSSCYDATTPGSYTCLLTDDCGSTTSTAAYVGVASPATGDFDGDGHVNLADWDWFRPCLSGPGIGLTAGCDCKDTDADVDADLADFGVLQRGFGS